MMARENTNQCLSLSVAGLEMTLVASQVPFTLKLPDDCHRPFQANHTAEANQASAVSDKLVISLEHVERLNPPENNKRLCVNDFFSLSLDSLNQLTFFAERERIPFTMSITPDFSAGKLEGSFPESRGQGFYPLQTMGIVLFANWLAQCGDVILHAAGFARDGKGYAFVGNAGDGKSTLMDAVLTQQAGEVLGEDQVVLRFLEDRFWIFGTPWHERSQMCSPVGVPLEKLFFLDRSQEQVCTHFSPFGGVQRLMQTAFIPYYRIERMPLILDRLALLSETVPFYQLSYRLGSDVLPIILET